MSSHHAEWRNLANYHHFFVFFIFAIELCSTCPISCSCKWKNGKQTVECINKDLLVIPEGMDSGTQVLEFCGNNLQTLHRDKFLKMGLTNLQRIHLCRCRLTALDDRTFKGLTNLVELDLSHNQLAAVPSAALRDCPSLMRLLLNSNPIRAIPKSAFHQLSFLATLELADCQIARIDEGAFHGLYSLEWLRLAANRLTALEGCAHLPDSLKGVQLHDNPWQCDCHLLDLHAWLLAFAYPHSVEPACSGPPRLRSRPIKSVAPPELACLPEVTPTTFYLELAEGKNVSLACEVNAQPEAAVSWTFHGQLIQNDSIVAPGVHLVYYLEEGHEEKRSELFIYNSNSDDNGTFVCQAENPAGVVQANFTIRVIVKHEQSIGANELPFEFVLIALLAASLLILLLLLVIVLAIVKCHRGAKLRKKRNNSKIALGNSTKDNLLQENTIEYSTPDKETASIKLATIKQETVVYSGTPPPADSVPASPSSALRRFHEQNPDVVNGTERSVGRFRECEAERELYVYVHDVHLDPVGLLEGRACYKTLPYGRAGKRGAASPAGRFSREAEFLSARRPAAYEHYGDVRYTADGYPVREPCCSAAWPAALVGELRQLHVRRSSVGAQTEAAAAAGKVHEALAESLDEGYEGEGAENGGSSCPNL